MKKLKKAKQKNADSKSHANHLRAPDVNGNAIMPPSVQLQSKKTSQDNSSEESEQNTMQFSGVQSNGGAVTPNVNPNNADPGETGPPKAQIQQNKTGLPDNLKSGIESLSGFSMDDVKVHYNSDKPAQLQAHAFAQGADIHLAPNQENQLAHEAWHVVQQKQGRVKPTIQLKGKININDNRGLEREADEMGAKAVSWASSNAGQAQLKQKAVQPISIQRRKTNVIQRSYNALSPMSKARVDQQSDEKYAEKASEFEFKMSPKIMRNRDVNLIVDLLVAKVKKIVDAWAVATGKELGATYEREFGWSGGDDYYGAFEMTANNITQVFADTSKPMRTKLKLVYNAVRNNNLAKWLKLAAIELDRKARGEKAKNWKIKTASSNVMELDNQRRQTGNLQPGVGLTKEVVKTGFAKNSGLEDTLTDQQVTDFSASTADQNLRTSNRSKREIFSHDRFGTMMNWHQDTQTAHGERRGNSSSGLSINEQRTLSVGDVPDLTDEEIDQIFIKQQNRKPNALERQQYRQNPNNKVTWGQGGEFYDVQLGSASSQAAATVKARMEAGISGSTDLMMHAMHNLGFSGDSAIMKGMRLALAGWMMANRDHSFYEIYKAADSYGLNFNLDANDPGAEYEHADHLFPMQRDDFRDTLPENVFPKYFLSTPYKDQLALALNNPGKDENAFDADLQAQGIPATTIASLDKRGKAEVAKLSEIVAGKTINPDDRYAKKMQGVRRIKLSSAYTYLGNTLGVPTSESILTSLLRRHHGFKGLTPNNNQTTILIDAGVPRITLGLLDANGIADLITIRNAIKGARRNRNTGALMHNSFNAEKARLLGRMSAFQFSDIEQVLWQTYHGSIFGQDKKAQADETRSLAKIRNSRDKLIEVLADANVPRAYSEKLGTTVLYDVMRLKQAVQSANFDTSGSVNAQTTNQQAFGKLQNKYGGLITHLRSQGNLIYAALLKKYHGESILSEDQKYLADFADMMKSRQDRERTGETRELNNTELGNLNPAKFSKSNGTKKAIGNTQYWSNMSARSRLQTNRGTVIDEYKKKICAQDREKAYRIFLKWSKEEMNNNEDALIQQEATLRAATESAELEGYLGYIPDDYLFRILPAEIQQNINELEGLNDKEIGAIFKYTTAEYVPIVLASNSLSTKEFSKDDVTDPNARMWGSDGGNGALSTLKYTNPMMKALISGLDKMTPYAGLAYRGEDSNQDLTKKTDQYRAQYAQQRFPVGKIEFRAYPMSSSTTEDAPTKAPGGDKFDIFYEISNIKTGKSIELLSNSPNEKEVLFAPGARFRIDNTASKNGGQLWVYMSEL